ncbi:MAG: hypothetical protein ACON5B_11250 [Myxococcota bacterium]
MMESWDTVRCVALAGLLALGAGCSSAVWQSVESNQGVVLFTVTTYENSDDPSITGSWEEREDWKSEPEVFRQTVTLAIEDEDGEILWETMDAAILIRGDAIGGCYDDCSCTEGSYLRRFIGTHPNYWGDYPFVAFETINGELGERVYASGVASVSRQSCETVEITSANATAISDYDGPLRELINP